MKNLANSDRPSHTGVKYFFKSNTNNMAIQWFPGHMVAARKNAGETMERADVVIEVLDARLPEASCNPIVTELRLFRQRPCLKILNKSDLADPAVTKAWLAFYSAQKNVTAVALSCKKKSDVAKIPGLCEKLAPHRNSTIKPLRMMIMGIPNVGKSTLMNALLNRRVAKVGDEPAVTKSQQRFDLDDTMNITDTPGMMWPKIEHDSDGFMLAASHAIGRNAVIDEDVALFLADNLLKTYPDLLNIRYKLDAMKLDASKMDGVDLLEAIAKRRSYKRHDGLWDTEKTAVTFLTDYRHGAIGRVSLETPISRTEMINAASKQEAPTTYTDHTD